MNFEKILNPVDGSEHSIHSTRYAIGLAKLLNATIVLMHCHENFPFLMAEPYFQQAVNAIHKTSEAL